MDTVLDWVFAVSYTIGGVALLASAIAILAKVAR